jgi:anti-sigma B factor antagonist
MKSADNSDELRIDAEQIEKSAITVVRIAGAIDAHTYEQIEEYFDTILSNGTMRLILDLSSVRYMSSAGIGVFVGALARTRQAGGDLLLLNMTPTVHETLEVLGLAPMFFVAPDKATAVAYFERQGLAAKR